MSVDLTYPPTAKMIKFAVDLASQTGVEPPGGYDQDYGICHSFLNRISPRKLDDQARDELRAIAPQVISSLLGEPNRRLSNNRELRWHGKGSFVLHLTGKYAGCWYDHANQTGGDIISFIQAEHCCSIGQAIQIGLALVGGTQRGTSQAPRLPLEPEEDDAGRIAQALAVWARTVPLRDSLAERYLRHRGILVADHIRALPAYRSLYLTQH